MKSMLEVLFEQKANKGKPHKKTPPIKTALSGRKRRKNFGFFDFARCASVATPAQHLRIVERRFWNRRFAPMNADLNQFRIADLGFRIGILEENYEQLVKESYSWNYFYYADLHLKFGDVGDGIFRHRD